MRTRARWLPLLTVLLVAALPASRPTPAQEEAPDPWRDDPASVVGEYLGRAGIEPIEVLVLGTFHFDDQGLDEYAPTHEFDALSERRQAEVGRVVDDLVRFAPEVLCVERRPGAQARLDERYRAFRGGALRDEPSEIVQIGFRVADALDLERLHAVDAPGRWLEPRVDPIEWAKANGALARLATPLQEVQAAYLKDRDRFIDRADLATILRYQNHPAVLATSHASYLVGTFHAGDGEEFPGPDGFVTQWFNRNLRIFANLKRVARPGQRVVLLIGAGHVPILKHCIESSPEFAWVPVAGVVRATR